jgi:uncharacterized cupredoxin-like copper-binding protein
MKKLAVSLMLALFFALPLLAQKTEKVDEEQTVKRAEVPQNILTAFEKSYPNAKIKGYSKETDEGKVVYEIESKEGKIARDVTYAADGNLVSVEESMLFRQLPKPVQAAMKKEFPKSKTVKCEKILKGSVTQYELVIRSGKKQQEVVFDADGKVLETEQAGEEDDKE